jgi:predicted ATPase
MLTQIRIQNFKAWEDTGYVDLARLNVLFGANSAGKTSIPQFLRMLRRTVESSDRRRALHLSAELGSFQDVLHKHDLSRALMFELKWRPASPLELRDPAGKLNLSATDLHFAATIMPDAHQQPVLKSFNYTAMGSGKKVRVGMKQSDKPGEYDLVAEGFRAKRQKGRAWKLPAPYHFNGFPDEVIRYFQNTAFVADLTLSLQEQLRSIEYVGPIRQEAKPLYDWAGEDVRHVGAHGEQVVEAILAARDRKYNVAKHKHRTSLNDLVASRLDTLGLTTAFEVRPIAKGRKEYEVRLCTRDGLPNVRLTDVGFGISQVLPVIVECFCAPPRSVVIFEQPEIHLHPRVQANLADVFIEAIGAREDGEPRDVQLIIESHSEHLLRRFQRRVAEELLPQTDAAFYFVNNAAGAARLHPLKLDIFGNIHNWPEEFFGDDMEDVVARMEAEARRSAESQPRPPRVSR